MIHSIILLLASKLFATGYSDFVYLLVYHTLKQGGYIFYLSRR